MKKKSKVRKKYNENEKLSDLVLGSIYEYDTLDPLGDEPFINNTSYGHENPIKRVLMKKNLLKMHKLFSVKPYRWRAEITIKFKEEVKGFEIAWFGVFDKCEDVYEEGIEKIFESSDMTSYVITHVKASVISLKNTEINDNDFTEEARGEAA